VDELLDRVLVEDELPDEDELDDSLCDVLEEELD